MTTPRTHSLVSLAAAVTIALTLAGCASAPVRIASDGPAPTDALPLAIRFENAAHDYVHVYLVGEKRQWLLGRVEIGARATLRIPEDALAEGRGADAARGAGGTANDAASRGERSRGDHDQAAHRGDPFAAVDVLANGHE